MSEALPRRVPARAGFEWMTGSFRLFLKSPLLLAAAAAIYLGALLILQFIPYAGAGLTEIITPMIVAGVPSLQPTVPATCVLDSLQANLPLAAKQLVMIANDNGGEDNVSVIVSRITTRPAAASGIRAFLSRLFGH